MPGAGLSWEASRKAPPDMLALKPYWGKPNVRNFRGGDGNVGIIDARLAPLPYPTARHKFLAVDRGELTTSIIGDFVVLLWWIAHPRATGSSVVG